ncbi:hypothetical protein BC835DRAFT_1505848 [Cytidiella melzeri]|nr:hypothetical protein BC835DRAFT_1505848 [Cytidiella melzeri]
MKSFAAISLFASVALASTIPTGLSTTCSSYLTTLDKDTTMATCTSAVKSATAAFAPGSNGTASATTALSSLCSNTNACSEATMRSTLADFYAACQPELTSSPNAQVMNIYDVLYTLVPYIQAACSKDDSGNYCITQLAGTPPAASSLYTGSQQTLTPNFSALQSSNAAFLFLDPTLDESKLCQSCTRSIMTSYISFESDISYAPGLAQSVLLKGQTALYQAIQTTCGGSFLSGAVQAAGSLSNSILGGTSGAASTRVPGSSGAGMIASLLGAVTVAVAAVL